MQCIDVHEKGVNKKNRVGGSSSKEDFSQHLQQPFDDGNGAVTCEKAATP